MAAGRTAEYPELMLNAHDVHVADVEKIGRAPIRGELLLDNFEPDDVGISIPGLDVVDRHGETIAGGLLGGHSRQQIVREGGDAAFARRVIAQEGDLSNFRCGFHALTPYAGLRRALPCPARTSSARAPIANVARSGRPGPERERQLNVALLPQTFVRQQSAAISNLLAAI